jgi:pimeloyl-ACP methyl ester carboxylesterase
MADNQERDQAWIVTKSAGPGVHGETSMPAPPPITRHYAQLPGLRLHYAMAGTGEPVLLIHGFPQTWQEWRHVMPALAAHYTVIAPDYRGAGDSDRPQGGYDKHTVMEDLRALMHQLGHQRVRVVGHDIGAMVAYRYAAMHPEEVQQLVLMDAPVPGTAALAQVRAMPRAWHANFHNVRDLPELLVAGREREYLTLFFKSRFTRPDAMSAEDIGIYVDAYSAPGAMRCGFELYRAWDQDARDNQPCLARKLNMPTLVLGAGGSASGSLLEGMMHEIAAHGQFRPVADAGHWLCEENPREVERLLLEFFATAPRKD